jgi:hypothetical protein
MVTWLKKLRVGDAVMVRHPWGSARCKVVSIIPHKLKLDNGLEWRIHDGCCMNEGWCFKACYRIEPCEGE